MWRCVLFVSLYFRNDTQVAFYGCFVCIANTNVILHTPISRRGAAASEQVSLILIFYKNQSTASLFLLYPTKPVGFCGNPVFAFCLSLCIFIRLVTAARPLGLHNRLFSLRADVLQNCI